MTDTPNLVDDVELRDKINSLRRQRDAHQMDEPEYVDAVLEIVHQQQQKAEAEGKAKVWRVIKRSIENTSGDTQRMLKAHLPDVDWQLERLDKGAA